MPAVCACACQGMGMGMGVGLECALVRTTVIPLLWEDLDISRGPIPRPCP